jgi:hypothetical protein
MRYSPGRPHSCETTLGMQAVRVANNLPTNGCGRLAGEPAGIVFDVSLCRSVRPGIKPGVSLRAVRGLAGGAVPPQIAQPTLPPWLKSAAAMIGRCFVSSWQRMLAARVAHGRRAPYDLREARVPGGKDGPVDLHIALGQPHAPGCEQVLDLCGRLLHDEWPDAPAGWDCGRAQIWVSKQDGTQISAWAESGRGQHDPVRFVPGDHGRPRVLLRGARRTTRSLVPFGQAPGATTTGLWYRLAVPRFGLNARERSTNTPSTIHFSTAWFGQSQQQPTMLGRSRVGYAGYLSEVWVGDRWR